MALEKGSFAEGIALFNTKGAYVKPVRMNKRIKEILLIMIEEDKNKTSTMFPEDEDSSEHGLHIFLSAMQWITNKITNKNLVNVKFSRRIAYEIFCWTADKKYHHLSDDKDFSNAMQWLTNHWSRKYAQSELMKG